MVTGGLLATLWTDAAPLVAVARSSARSAGFSAVLAVTISIERAPVSTTWRRPDGRLLHRTSEPAARWSA
ncbi:hypothetical protein [Microbacterium sp. LWH3-1.2]|uniref:hypothetical protein n=1 Tax=Microbacterium sp. LWH3-1.2 TaxID=3135256 RepID=UPI00343701A1